MKSNSCLVPYGPYQGAKKVKQFASSTKSELGYNICSAADEMLNSNCLVLIHLWITIFTSFRLFVSLPTLELT